MPRMTVSVTQASDNFRKILTYLLYVLIFCFLMTACASKPVSSTAPFTGVVIVQRHGQSEANVEGIIASTPQTATKAFGLSAKGKMQARQSATEIKEIIDQTYPDRPIVIASSPLLRTQQTALEDLKVFGKDHAVILSDMRFTERDFSYFEGKDDNNYEKVWAYDRIGRVLGSAFDNKVEELVSVRDRTQGALTDLKQHFSNAVIVVVTHGDVASNMIALDKGIGLGKHREVGALPTAGYRVLTRK